MRSVTKLRNYVLATLVCASVVALLGGCAPVKRRTFDDPVVEYSYHTVNYQGETLSLIARWYTGQAGNWEALMDHNPDLDPRKLQIGDLVKIPQDLLIREDEMPKKFVANATAKVAAGKAGASAPPAKVGDVAGGAVAEPPPTGGAPSVLEQVEAAVVRREEDPAKTEARTKTRDELLQELLADQ
jgi:hypothetical protein